MQALVNNRPEQLTLSVSVPGKQRLESYLNVRGFITEGGREREKERSKNKTKRKKERKHDQELIKGRSRCAHLVSVPTFGFALDQLLHLALFQCVHHVCQAALAPLRGPEGPHGRAAVVAGPPPASAFLFAW